MMSKKYLSVAGGLFLTAFLLVLVVFTSQQTSRQGNVTRVAPKASSPTGTVTARLDPASNTVGVGQTIPLAIKINPGSTVIGSLQTRITYTYTSAGAPEVDVVGTPVAGVSQLTYSALTVTRNTTNKTVTIDVLAYSDPQVNPNGYQPNAEFTFATFNVIANAGANVTMSFDPVNSKVIQKLPSGAGPDVLSSTLPASVVVAYSDSTPPVVTIGTKPAAVSNNKSPSFTFTATDPESGLATSPYGYQLTGQTKVTGLATGTAGFTNLPDGSYTFTAYAVNGVNLEGNASYNFVVDATAPTVTINTPVNNSLTNQTTVPVSWTGNDRTGTVLTYKYRLDNTGSWATTTGTSYSWSGLTSGSHTFSVYATDDAANVGPTVSTTFTVDLTAPVVTITGPTGTGNSASFTFTATDANGLSTTPAPYGYQLSGQSKVSGLTTGAANFTNLADGSYTFTAFALDKAGNEGSAQKTFTIDTTGAAVTMTSGPTNGQTVSTSTVTFGFSSETGATFQTQLDGAAWVNCATATTCSVTYNALTSGAHVFKVHAKDTVGNTGSDVQINFTVSLSGSLSFTIYLEGYGPQYHPAKTVRVRLYSGTTVSATYNVPVTSDSTGVVWSGSLTGVTPGTYNIYVKGPTHLQKNLGPVTFTAGGTATGSWSATRLLTGDIAGSTITANLADNMIDSSDLGFVINDFAMGTQKTSLADLTGDGMVDSSDLALIITNFKIGVYGDGGAE